MTMQKDRARSGSALGAGMTLIASVVSFTLGGYWLDGKCGTQPLFLLLGIALGFLGGMIHLFNAVAPEMLPFGKSKPPLDSHPGDPPAPKPPFRGPQP